MPKFVKAFYINININFLCFQRDRKERKLYTDDWMLGEEDDIEGRRSFRLEDKMETDKFTTTCFVKEMNGADLTLSYLQKNG